MATLHVHPLFGRARVRPARPRLGGRKEDLATVAALAGIECPERLVVSIGFGVDTHHGVSHGPVLENFAALERAGAYQGRSPYPVRPGREHCSSTRSPKHRSRRPPRGIPH